LTSGIEISIQDQVQIIRFARPEKKNAFTAASYTAMTEALAAGDASGDVAVHLFVGSERVFTAGNDIGDFLASAEAGGGGQGLSQPVRGFIRALPRVQKPMIAAVDGLAVGIGTTLMFHCDLVYATPEASFRTPFVDLRLDRACLGHGGWGTRVPFNCWFWVNRCRQPRRVRPGWSMRS